MKVTLIRSVVTFFCLAAFSANVASAQSTSSNTAQNNDGQSTATSQTTTQPGTVKTPFWEPMGGFDLDSHSTGYAWAGPQYQHPVRDNLAITARAAVNYLFYEFEEDGGVTKVSGPGLSTQVGLKFGDKNWFKVGAGPSFKRRNQQFEINGAELDQGGEWRTGLNVGADAYGNPTSRTNVMAQAQYSTEDNFTWSRLAGKRQLSNYSYTGTFAHFAGAEAIGMGNEDFKALQLGALFEFLHVPSSMSFMLRAGYKRSMFDLGPDKSGPYFGIGYYQRLK